MWSSAASWGSWQPCSLPMAMLEDRQLAPLRCAEPYDWLARSFSADTLTET